MEVIEAGDLFCGSGGTSSGIVDACAELGYDVDLLGVNHWPRAIESHRLNFPKGRQLLQNVEAVDPRKAVPSGHLHVLAASPECTYHSIARGARPVDEQLRASPWSIPRWLCELHVDGLMVENVPEFADWGPLDEHGRPIKSRQGQTFLAWTRAIEACGYSVDWRVLNAADYGDATTRRRLVVLARRGGKLITWPTPTHAPSQWHTAREIIDWELKGRSIFGRRKPIVDATMRRIQIGLRKFSGEPFIIKYYRTGTAVSVDEPLDTITTKGRFALVQPRRSDIFLRMFQPHELARAMSFRPGYVFAGTACDQIKQIGNAVPVRLATAVCKALLSA